MTMVKPAAIDATPGYRYADGGQLGLARAAVDLHCHSHASDGALSPGAVVERAARMGVKLLALTDHDTMMGYEEARLAADNLDIQLIAGVELSCQWNGQTIHVLGLNLDVASADWLSALELQQQNRQNRALMIGERLRKQGLPATYEAALALAAGGVPGRPHFAQALVDLQAVPSIAQAFKRYLGAGRPGDVKVYWPELAQIVAWICSASGVAVLAHPRKYKMTASRLRKLVADFQQAGGEGLEVLTGGQPASDTSFLADLCKTSGCLASMGSDFHAPGMPWNELGSTPPLPAGLTPVWSRF